MHDNLPQISPLHMPLYLWYLMISSHILLDDYGILVFRNMSKRSVCCAALQFHSIVFRNMSARSACRAALQFHFHSISVAFSLVTGTSCVAHDEV